MSEARAHDQDSTTRRVRAGAARGETLPVPGQTSSIFWSLSYNGTVQGVFFVIRISDVVKAP